jgi:hypothetical protein
MPDGQDAPPADRAGEARRRIAALLAEQHRVHAALLVETRRLKRFSTEGAVQLELELAAELLEQYQLGSDAFRENMRGRFEARLPLLRRGEPQNPAQKAEDSAAHGAFWLAFSRLSAALRRVAHG